MAYGGVTPPLQVYALPPDAHIPTHHHGPPPGKITLPTAAKPRYFQNPWPSYRMPSLSDAWQAYQRGAAIAPHPDKVSRTPSRSQSRASDRPGEDVGLLQGEEDGDEVYAPNPNEAFYLDTGSRLRRKLYIRPELAAWYDEDEEDDWRDPPIEVVQPDWGLGARQKVQTTWLGHAGAMVRIPWKEVEGGQGREGMCGVVFDPIFSYRCSPSQYVGPARYHDPPCKVEDLPPIHVCCISHDHYDHLDYYTIMDLWKHHGETIHFFVGLGLKQWFISCGIPSQRITELDWWHETILVFPPSSSISSSTSPPDPSPSTPSLEYPPHGPPPASTLASSSLTLKLAFTPAQHRSGRGLLDHMTTLWGSWVVGVVDKVDERRIGERGMQGWTGFKMFFGGDTGYRYATAPEGDETAICPAFSQIAANYSPLSLSFLPVSTGSSLPFLRTLLSLSLDQYLLTSSQHCSPDDALRIHEVLQSERTVGVHWGTFCDGDEARGTRVEFGRGRRARGISGRWVDEEGEEERVDQEGKGRFVLVNIGETVVMP